MNHKNELIREQKEALAKQKSFEVSRRYYSFSWDEPYIRTYVYKGIRYNQHEFLSLDCKFPAIFSITKIKKDSWMLWNKSKTKKEAVEMAINHFRDLSNRSLEMKGIFDELNKQQQLYLN